MDYEKKYKETVKKLQELLDDAKKQGHIIVRVEDIENTFPELVESEDEKIRKELIEQVIYIVPDKNEVDDNGNTLPCYTTRINKYITWLEKQESVREIVERCKNSWYNEGKIQGQIEGLSDDEKYLQGWHDALEKQSEQKFSTEVAPKFHEGEWLIDKEDNTIFTITKVLEHSYKYITNTGKEYYCTHYSLEQDARPWTIQDAQDGDVLSCNDGHGNDCIELIKSITGKKIEFWFCLTNGNSYEVFDGITPYTNVASRKDATPATKEQRDLLFTKMREAGYEWDAEKKELKKTYVIDEGKDEIDYCFTKMMNGEKVTPAWSEEDENGLGDALWAIQQARTIAKDENDMGNLWFAENWLKSLKDRIQAQPKQEWSEEDEKMLNSLLHKVEVCDLLTNKENVWIVKKLKSLRPQQQWKPSDEQITELRHAISGCSYDVEPLIEIEKQLKKLKE